VDEDFRIEPLGFLRLLRDTSIGGLLTFQRDCSALAISLLISPLSIFYYLRTYFTGCRLDFWFNYTVARTHTLTGTRYILRAVIGL